MIDLRFDSVSKKYLIRQEEEDDPKARSLAEGCGVCGSGRESFGQCAM